MKKKFDFEKAQFYYVRKNGHRIGTVCLYEVPPTRSGVGKRSMYCRGISICSIKDNFNSELGKKEALFRCRKAYYTRVNSEEIVPAEGKALTLLRFMMEYQGYQSRTSPTYKSAWTNRLSEFEKKIMSCRKNYDYERANLI